MTQHREPLGMTVTRAAPRLCGIIGDGAWLDCDGDRIPLVEASKATIEGAALPAHEEQ